MTVHTRADLERLWRQAGGNAAAASMAAAVALAASGGRGDMVTQHGDGTVSRGAWQVNSVHGPLSTTDALANARAAVQLSANGRTWRMWPVAWNGRSYLTGAPVMRQLPVGDGTGQDPASVNAAMPELPIIGDALNPKAWLQPIFTVMWYSGMGLLGVVLFIAGVTVMVLESRSVQSTIAAVSGSRTAGFIRARKG